MVKVDPPKLVPPGTYFAEKFGPPLKNLDPPGTYFAEKFWTPPSPPPPPPPPRTYFTDKFGSLLKIWFCSMSYST